MNIISRSNFKGHIIICDPLYIVKDEIDKSSMPKLEDFVPIDCTPDMLKNDEINTLYKYGMEDYYYELDLWKKNVVTDWDKSEYGQDMSKLGFKHFAVCEMPYGYGSYGVYEKRTNTFLGQFCSDSGSIGVFSLEEVLGYDESFDKFNTMPWAVCFIPNYNGAIAWVNRNDKTDISADITLVGFGNLNIYSKQVGF